MTATARYATKPTPGALSDIGSLVRLARVLKRPLMPWQRQVLRVGTERSLADPRRYRYREVRVSVPRQSGKTTADHVDNVHRTVTTGRSSFYTAQTGKDARERWLDCRAMVDGSPLKRFIAEGNPYGGAVRLAAGNAAIHWPNGGEIRPFAPTAASLHGYTPHRVTEDEVWDYDEIQGEALDGAIGPAQITLPHGQRWLYSTMGDADSTFWHRLVAEGQAATDDPDAEIAYFEWSADPGSDLYDPANWAKFHPALGHTIDIIDLTAAAKRETSGVWSRAYCNIASSARETVVDMDTFRLRGDAGLRLTGKGSMLAYDVAHDSSQATISLARPVGEDSVGVRVLKSAPGVEWLAESVIAYRQRWEMPTVHADDGGPTREVTEALRRRGFDVTTTSGVEFGTACGAWLRRIRDGRIKHDGSAVLEHAQAAAKLRPMGDAVAFSRAASAGPIDALIASAVAVRAALLAPAEHAPFMWFPSDP